jgi:hypothetical protein
VLHAQEGESCQEPIYIKLFGLNVKIASVIEFSLVVGSVARPCLEGVRLPKNSNLGAMPANSSADAHEMGYLKGLFVVLEGFVSSLEP